MDKFIEQTKKAIREDCSDLLNRLGRVSVNYSRKRGKIEGILVLGLNPAGDESTVKIESVPDYLYLNYVPNAKLPNFTNTNYFKVIYNVLNQATGDNAKWDWCNLPLDEIVRRMSRNPGWEQSEEAILDFYNKERSKRFTVFCGDMFYLHMTSQKDFLECINPDSAYIKDMLDLHIDELESIGVNIKMIYTNNACVSDFVENALRSKEESVIDYNYNNKKYKIVLGAMLSGQRAMDRYSRFRLIKEMKSIFQ